jgi:SanA protein
MKHTKVRRQILTYRLIDLVVLGAIFFVGINTSILVGTRHDLQQVEDIKITLDAVLVLGASVQWLQLSPVLQDRVETAIQMYNAGKTYKIIISGDNGKKYYNEVDAMYTYLRNRGIPTLDIIMDTEWYSTFLSISNLARIADLHTIGIVTQEFHLPRAIFIAQSLGFQPIGIISDRSSYTHADDYEKRELFARIKAFFDVAGWWIGVR